MVDKRVVLVGVGLVVAMVLLLWKVVLAALFGFVMMRFIYVRIVRPFTVAGALERPDLYVDMMADGDSVEAEELSTIGAIQDVEMTSDMLVEDDILPQTQHSWWQSRWNEIVKQLRSMTKTEMYGAGAFLGVMMVFVVMPCFILRENLIGTEPNPYMVIGFNFFGSMLILVVCITLVDFGDIVRHLYRFRAVDLSQGIQETRIKAFVSLGLYVICVIVALARSYSAPTVQQFDILSPKIPTCLDGFKMLLITDYHAGPLAGRKEVERLVAQANGLSPDIILLGGDFADGPTPKVGEALAPLKSLVAREGVFFVPGNHEYLHGSNGVEWVDFMVHENGITSLNNTFQVVGNTSQCSGINLVGVDDYSEGKPDLAGAMQGLDDTKGLFTLLLAHQPNESREAAKTKNIDMQLSGHTHHGSIWPIHGWSYLTNTHFAGLESENDNMLVYTSSGSIGWGPRTRFLSSNNIDLITLRNSQVLTKPAHVHPAIIWAWISLPYMIIVLLFSAFFHLRTATTN